MQIFTMHESFKREASAESSIVSGYQYSNIIKNMREASSAQYNAPSLGTENASHSNRILLKLDSNLQGSDEELFTKRKLSDFLKPSKYRENTLKSIEHGKSKPHRFLYLPESETGYLSYHLMSKKENEYDDSD